MQRLRAVTQDDVLAASEDERATRDLLRVRRTLELWLWEAPDFGEIHVLNPDDKLPDGPVAEAKLTWLRQAEAGDEKARASLARVAELQRDLVQDGRYRRPPILNDREARPSLHAGRHRLVAAHACWTEGTFVRPIEILWVLP